MSNGRILRIDRSHATDVVHFKPGDTTQADQSMENLSRAIICEKAGFTVDIVVEQQATYAKIRFALGTSDDPRHYPLGEVDVPFNTDVSVREIIKVPLLGIREYIDEILDRR